MGIELIPGYNVKSGSRLDRALLVKFMQRTYTELYPHNDFAHLAKTVDQYLAGDTRLWWVIPNEAVGDHQPNYPTSFGRRAMSSDSPIACLWLGNAVDQIHGDRHTYIFLLYVAPHQRRQGIGSALVRQAEAWATSRGDRQIALQVFHDNAPAQALYRKLGYGPKSVWMTKPLQQS
ncbi:MAG: GNAT family N-acetyltransferase [Cyanobacteria bacterium J06627_8]